MHARWILLATSMALSSARPTSAQSHDPAAAEVLFRKGRDAMKAGDFGAACPKFAESQRLDPAAGTLLNLAQCEEKLGQLASAWQHYQEAADQLPPGDPRIGMARKGVADLDKLVPRLVVRLGPNAPRGTSVRRGGVELGAASLGTPLPVDPGEHVVVVSAPGRKETRVSVHVKPGETKTVNVEVGEAVPSGASTPPSATSTAGDPKDPAAAAGAPRSPEPASATDPGSSNSAQKTIGYVVGGLGVVGLGLGVYFAMDAKSKDDRAAGDHCPNDICDAAGLKLNQDARSEASVAGVAFGLGGAALVAGVVLVLTSPTSTGGAKPAAVRVRPVATPSSLGLGVGGAW
jgi:hypothetical protein